VRRSMSSRSSLFLPTARCGRSTTSSFRRIRPITWPTPTTGR
jgi:hypothetical protein